MAPNMIYMKKNLFILPLILIILSTTRAHLRSEPIQLGAWLQNWIVYGPFPNSLAEGVKEYRQDETTLGYYTDFLIAIGGENNVQPQDGLTFKDIEGQTYTRRDYDR